MITNKDINEIREFLENSNNPVFLFDDDPDGVCAYLLLKKHYGKGIGIATKGPPNIEEKYLSVVKKHNPDLIVVLDKPILDQEFIDNSPCQIIWLDHHPLIKRNNVKYYNPRTNDLDDNRPTTYLAYSVVKTNLWIAMLGCVFDYYIPDFTKEFINEYPDLMAKTPKDPGEAKYATEFGKIINIFSFNLKGESKDINKSMKSFEEIKTPYEIFNKESEAGIYLYKRFEKLDKEYKKLLEKAEKSLNEDKILLFTYLSNETSFTGDLANEMSYKYSDKIIIIGRRKDDRVIMSIRSKKIKILYSIEKSLVGINGYGGGHDYACGASVDADDFERFIENFRKEII